MRIMSACAGAAKANTAVPASAATAERKIWCERLAMRDTEANGIVRENSFARVVDDYLTKCVIGPNPEKPRQRKAHDVARVFRNVFIPLCC
jgi:hypothetical protein